MSYYLRHPLTVQILCCLVNLLSTPETLTKSSIRCTTSGGPILIKAINVFNFVFTAPNMQDSETEFDRAHVTNQVRSLQVLETVNLMARGFPHRMRFKAFNGRYRMLATPMNILKRTDEKSVEDCELILDCYSQLAKEYFPESSTEPNNKDWAHGRKHIFLSEGARQQLEYLRIHIRTKSATKIQSVFRGYLHRKRFKINNALNKPNPNSNMNRTVAVPVLPISPAQRAETGPIIQPQIPISQANNVSNLNLMIQMQKQQQSFRSHQNRPKPISCTPPPFDASTSTGMQSDKCDYKTIQQTCSLFGLDLVRKFFIVSVNTVKLGYSVMSQSKLSTIETFLRT